MLCPFKILYIYIYIYRLSYLVKSCQTIPRTLTAHTNGAQLVSEGGADVLANHHHCRVDYLDGQLHQLFGTLLLASQGIQRLNQTMVKSCLEPIL